jgi:hypothetical protein
VIALPVLVGLGLATLAGSAQAATIWVTNASDANAGSLRRAMEAAEQQPDLDTIKFAIPGAGVHTITPVSDLPVLTHPVKIKGYTQLDAEPATSERPADLKIEIDAGLVNRGLDIGGDGIEVRGLAIHSARDVNVFIEGQNAVVAGNHLGTNPAGDEAISAPTNKNVEMIGSGHLIGGSRAADRNVISGALIEVCVQNGENEITNNRIGTSADGTRELSDAGYGVELHIAAGASVVRDNLVSGTWVGVEVMGDGNTVQGNKIGTDIHGTAAIPNGTGINVEGGDDNTIGGTGAGEGNLISGNAYEGVQLEYGDDDPVEELGPAVGNRLVGNLIGTDASGAVPLGNGSTFGLQGVVIHASDGNTIGSHEPGAGNVIAANAGDGIEISGDGNLVLGNAIGTNMDGALGLGNGRNGVHISGNENNIGDESGASMNTIAYNGEDGVAIEGTAATNTVVRNLIFVNGTSTDDIGIDLNVDGRTANDADDVDNGPNDLLNFPVVTAADATAGTVDWTLDGLGLTHYRLEFYASPFCDGSGNGEGQHYLGSVYATTNAKGRAHGTTATATPPAAGDNITMTATRRTLTGLMPLTSAVHETSEFSPCHAV